LLSFGAESFVSQFTIHNLKMKIYRNIILPVVLYGCETWSLTLREGCRLRVFENRVLRRIFGPRRDKVTGEWRKLHNEVLNDLYSSSNIVRVIKSRRMRWAWHVARIGEGRSVHRVLVGKPGGKRPLGIPRHHHHHHHISVMELGHLLTRSGLTYPEVCSKVCHDSFCKLENSVSFPWVIYYEAFYLHVVSSFPYWCYF